MAETDTRVVVTEGDREAAVCILEVWGGVLNQQVVSDTERGLRDDEDGYAGHLVQAFARHRLASQAQSAARVEAIPERVSKLGEDLSTYWTSIGFNAGLAAAHLALQTEGAAS